MRPVEKEKAGRGKQRNARVRNEEEEEERKRNTAIFFFFPKRFHHRHAALLKHGCAEDLPFGTCIGRPSQTMATARHERVCTAGIPEQSHSKLIRRLYYMCTLRKSLCLRRLSSVFSWYILCACCGVEWDCYADGQCGTAQCVRAHTHTHIETVAALKSSSRETNSLKKRRKDESTSQHVRVIVAAQIDVECSLLASCGIHPRTDPGMGQKCAQHRFSAHRGRFYPHTY